MMRQVAGGMEPVHQDFEGYVLVFVGRQAALAHPGHQLGDAGVAAQVDPQNQGVDEKADDIVERRIAAAGDREAHRHIGTRADLRQQHGQGRLHDHEGGRVVGPRHLRDPLLQFGRPLDVDARAAVVGDRRVGAIGRQFEAFGHPGQRVLPVPQLRGDGAARIVEVTGLGALP
ncbi:hypothetical protein MINTM003_30990 [Mycobacterium paraintracellulare]|nr:hypothetical protein MINTM003_30990 [Mycobacterium paraintracellulare]